MNYNDLKQQPEWVRNLHAAAENLSSAILSCPASHYSDLADIRDVVERMFLAQVGIPGYTIEAPGNA